MPTEPSDHHHRQTTRRATYAVAGLGILVLVIACVAGYSLLKPAPSASSAGGAPAGAAAADNRNGIRSGAVQAGLDAAAKYTRDGKFAEASAILAKLTETDPADQAVRVAHAQALMGQKLYDDAYKQYEAAVALLPSDTTKRIAEGGDRHAAQIHFEAGTCANVAGKIDRAIEHYSMAQTADRREPRYPLYLGMVQLKKGDKESESAASASLLRAAQLNPELGEAWGTLGEIALRNDQLGIATQHIEKARKLQPDALRWRLIEARILNRRGEAQAAAALLSALEPSRRHDGAVLTILGESYGLMRKPAEAARMYAEAFAAVIPPNPELAYQAALWFKRADDGAQADKFARVAAGLGHAEAAQFSAADGERK